MIVYFVEFIKMYLESRFEIWIWGYDQLYAMKEFCTGQIQLLHYK
jgi:hypothetical protein